MRYRMLIGLLFVGCLEAADLPPQDSDIYRRLSSSIESVRLDAYYLSSGEAISGSFFMVPSNGKTIKPGSKGVKNAKVRFDIVSVMDDRCIESVMLTVTNLIKAGARPYMVPFILDPVAIPVGRYWLTVAVMDPQGGLYETNRRIMIAGESVSLPARATLNVVHPYDYLFRTECRDASEMLTGTKEIGNPNRERFPSDDVRDSFTRTIWDMQTFEERVYLGNGDAYYNRGPVDIWSFEVNGSGNAVFHKETTPDEEMVDLFRVYNGSLYVPGADPKGADTGSLYRKRKGQWERLVTQARTRHACDVAFFRDRIYLGASWPVLFESEDEGRNWTQHKSDIQETGYRWLTSLMPMDDFLFIADHPAESYLRYSQGEFKRHYIPLLPGYRIGEGVNLRRLCRYQGGLLYTVTDAAFGFGKRSDSPLYYLSDFKQGAMLVEQFRDDRVRDILVRGATCYVLTEKRDSTQSAKDHLSFEGNIYASSNLRQWERLAQFYAQARPVSFEELGGFFYVGLGSRWNERLAASGAVLKIMPNP